MSSDTINLITAILGLLAVLVPILASKAVRNIFKKLGHLETSRNSTGKLFKKATEVTVTSLKKLALFPCEQKKIKSYKRASKKILVVALGDYLF